MRMSKSMSYSPSVISANDLMDTLNGGNDKLYSKAFSTIKKIVNEKSLAIDFMGISNSDIKNNLANYIIEQGIDNNIGSMY